MTNKLLGTLTPAAFLRRHWQKKPLLVRGAVPDCGAWLTRGYLVALAARDEVESRLVTRERGRWRVEHGPISAARMKRLPARGWTLLVQGLEQHDREAARLLKAFSFIPHARLDDLMVSYAPPGGGVGPHFDSYDVFLLQAHGQRRWRISAQKNLDLVEDAPLRILQDFRHTREWVTRQGDLLYLPPRYAHEGVALEACMTLSVGFRAPRHQELASRFLEHVQDGIDFDGLYEDPDLALQRHPGEIFPSMVEQFARVLARIQWNAKDVRRFAGCYLTEPRPNVVFYPPSRPLSVAAFTQGVARQGLRLALASRMLFAAGEVFINGDTHVMPASGRRVLVRLANDREIAPGELPPSLIPLLYGCYCAGYLT